MKPPFTGSLLPDGKGLIIVRTCPLVISTISYLGRYPSFYCDKEVKLDFRKKTFII